MNSDHLPENVKKLLSRAIATKLKIRRDKLLASKEAVGEVARCLTIIKAIADDKTGQLDNVVDALATTHLDSRERISRRFLMREVNRCYERFDTEIYAIGHMRQMQCQKIDCKPKAIWDWLRGYLKIHSEYEEDLQGEDDWIRRGIAH